MTSSALKTSLTAHASLPSLVIMKTLALIFALFTLSLQAADFDSRAAFGSAPGRDIDAALKRAQKENKRVLVAVYDSKDDYNNQGLQIKYFTDLAETKKLLKEHFIVVLLDRNHKDLAKYSGGINLERPHYILLSSTGSKLKDDTLCANPEDGLRRTKEIIALP